jgi:Spy/CpxP family protein refolding chaperone
MAEAALAHAKLDHAVYQLLTPAQQQQLQEWEARKESRHHAK